MKKVLTLTMSGYENEPKNVTSISLSDLEKGITFKNFNNQNVTITGVKNSYLSRVRMGLGFDDITQSFISLKDVKDYIKRNIAK